MILQDTPHVLQRALEVEGMERMTFDFLTEQPVKGKYKLSSLDISCLVNYSDAAAFNYLQVLALIISARLFTTSTMRPASAS